LVGRYDVNAYVTSSSDWWRGHINVKDLYAGDRTVGVTPRQKRCVRSDEGLKIDKGGVVTQLPLA